MKMFVSCLLSIYCAALSQAQIATITELKTNIADKIEDVGQFKMTNRTSVLKMSKNASDTSHHQESLQGFAEQLQGLPVHLDGLHSDSTAQESSETNTIERRAGGPPIFLTTNMQNGKNQRGYSTLDHKGHMHTHTFSEEHVHVDDHNNILDQSKIKLPVSRPKPNKPPKSKYRPVKTLVPSSGGNRMRKNYGTPNKRRSKPRLHNGPSNIMKPPPIFKYANKGPDYAQEIKFHDYDDFIVPPVPTKLYKKRPKVEDINQAFKRQKNFKDIDALLNTMSSAKQGLKHGSKKGATDAKRDARKHAEKHNSQYRESTFDGDFVGVKTAKKTTPKQSTRSVIPTIRPHRNKTLADYKIHVEPVQTTKETKYYDIDDIPFPYDLAPYPLDKPIKLPQHFNLHSTGLADIHHENSKYHHGGGTRQKFPKYDFTTSQPFYNENYYTGDDEGHVDDEAQILNYSVGGFKNYPKHFSGLQTGETKGVVTVVSKTKKIRIRGRPRDGQAVAKIVELTNQESSNPGEGHKPEQNAQNHETNVQHNHRPEPTTQTNQHNNHRPQQNTQSVQNHKQSPNNHRATAPNKKPAAQQTRPDAAQNHRHNNHQSAQSNHRQSAQNHRTEIAQVREQRPEPTAQQSHRGQTAQTSAGQTANVNGNNRSTVRGRGTIKFGALLSNSRTK